MPDVPPMPNPCENAMVDSAAVEIDMCGRLMAGPKS